MKQAYDIILDPQEDFKAISQALKEAGAEIAVSFEKAHIIGALIDPKQVESLRKIKGVESIEPHDIMEAI